MQPTTRSSRDRRVAAVGSFAKQNIFTSIKGLGEALTLPDILTSKFHSSLLLFDQARTSLQLLRHVELRTLTQPMPAIQALFALPPVTGRDISPLVDASGKFKVLWHYESSSAWWRLCLCDNANPEKNKRKPGSQGFEIAYDISLPAVPKDGAPARQHTFSTAPIVLSTVYFSRQIRKNKESIVTIMSLDSLESRLMFRTPKDDGSPKTEIRSHLLDVSIDRCKTTIVAPTLPLHHFFPLHVTPTGLDAAERTCYVNALALMRYLQWRLRDVVGTKAELEDRIAKLTRPFVDGSSGGHQIYRTEIDVKSRCRYILPNDKAAAVIAWTAHENSKGSSKTALIPIKLNSPAKKHVKAARNAAATVSDNLDATVLDVWMAMCMVVDDTNAQLAEGEDPIYVDTCNADQSLQHWRSCDDCEQDYVCAALRHHPVWQEDYCETCYDRATARLECPDRLAHSRLQRVHHQEATALRIDKARETAELAAITGSMPGAVNLKQVTIVQDDYFPTKARSSFVDVIWIPRSADSPKDPFAVSPDAIFQRHSRIAVNGVSLETALYCPGNVAFTAQYFSDMKYIWPPAMLQRVRDYHIATKEVKPHDVRKAIWDDISRLCDIANETEYAKSSRLGKKVTRRQVDFYRQRLMTGVSASFRDEVRETTALDILGTTLAAPAANWKPEGLDRFLEVVRQIEEEFKYTGIVMACSSIDDCPWPFHCAGMPTDWSWWTAWQLFGIRLSRIWVACHGRWIQSDSIETLFLEAIWQCLEGRHRWLRLPLMAGVRDPFRFVIAPAHHGGQLRSRWTKWEPESIEDRDDSLLNMVFETAVENYAKRNYNEQWYDEMRADFEGLHMGVHLWNPAGAGAQPVAAPFDLNADKSDERACNEQLLALGE
ncbi:hypothetical protein LTR02_013513 [Friedmanniomyces endolithicus]|nr:hypothetical protein LTR38_013772 [Friedmanniomyces endolithicus]KAK0802978.1 hypothetical protein LTR59_004825 [Friedmanniomyces endolithicus]KAK0807652.1 hypothetical protein LTR75_006526 [Friedmanniomyces endolithicus]KAK0846101.1 hypothetical protein LTR03_007109 [Friedmanniomyces endolithicus]KAK0881582.1 hypothetical protein LTR87_004539 [Friedmanniomyces endolithicus]